MHAGALAIACWSVDHHSCMHFCHPYRVVFLHCDMMADNHSVYVDSHIYSLLYHQLADTLSLRALSWCILDVQAITGLRIDTTPLQIIQECR